MQKCLLLAIVKNYIIVVVEGGVTQFNHIGFHITSDVLMDK